MDQILSITPEIISKTFNDLRRAIQDAADMVTEGEINAFLVGREISYTKNTLEQAKEKISNAEKAEYELYTAAELKLLKVQLAGGGYTYKYDHIPEWVMLNDQIKAVEENAKKAFQAALSNDVIANHETGEVITAAFGNPKKQSVSYR